MPHFCMGLYMMLLRSSCHETSAFSLGKVNYCNVLIRRKSMLKEVVTTEREMVCGCILMLVLRRLLIFIF